MYQWHRSSAGVFVPNNCDSLWSELCFGFYFTAIDGTPNELKVLFGNTVAFDLINTPSSATLLPYSRTVMATSSSTTLTFLGRQDPGLNRLDDVSVNATGTSTPEPSTLLLVGGLLPLAAAFRRRML